MSADKSVNFRNNSLSLFRLIAAIDVLYGHAVRHMNITIPGFVGGY